MNVYFVGRSFYEGPSGLGVSRVQAGGVLGCFRDRWPPRPGDPNVGALFLQHVLSQAAENGLGEPRTMAELAAHVGESVYDPEVVVSEHALQVLTDNDDIELATYVFDDAFRAAAAPSHTAFLLHPGWRLPGGEGPAGFAPEVDAAPLLPAGGEEGATWVVLLQAEDSSCLREMRAPMRIDGVRLPGLCQHLTGVEPLPGEPGGMDWPWELRLLRTQAAGPGGLGGALGRTNALDVRRVQRLGYPHHEGLEGDLGSACRELAGRLRQVEEKARARPLVAPADPSRSCVQAEEHVAQLCLNVTGPGHRFHPEAYFRWLFFDDLWAAARPELANGILRFADRWDVLSGDF
jgi:hypothetical protein